MMNEIIEIYLNIKIVTKKELKKLEDKKYYENFYWTMIFMIIFNIYEMFNNKCFTTIECDRIFVIFLFKTMNLIFNVEMTV